MLKRMSMLAFAAAVLVAPAGLAVAQDAKAVYDKRVATMKSNGAQMGAITRFVRGEAEFSPAIVTAAETLDANAKVYMTLFTPGSAVEGSRAKPEIWTNAADFQTKVTAFQTATAALAVAAKTGDKAQIQPALQAVGGQCGACHQAYQAPR
jgi:cytochrome c556